MMIAVLNCFFVNTSVASQMRPVNSTAVRPQALDLPRYWLGNAQRFFLASRLGKQIDHL